VGMAGMGVAAFYAFQSSPGDCLPQHKTWTSFIATSA